MQSSGRDICKDMLAYHFMHFSLSTVLGTTWVEANLLPPSERIEKVKGSVNIVVCCQCDL